MQVDRSLLTLEQARAYDIYQIGFTTDFWKDIMARLDAVYAQLGKQYDGAVGEQSLGRIQGARQSLAWVFALPQVIENEFLTLTGQIGGGDEPDVPVEAGDWQA